MSDAFADIDRRLYEAAGAYSNESSVGKRRDHAWAARSMPIATALAHRLAALGIRRLKVEVRSGTGDKQADRVVRIPGKRA